MRYLFLLFVLLLILGSGGCATPSGDLDENLGVEYYSDFDPDYWLEDDYGAYPRDYVWESDDPWFDDWTNDPLYDWYGYNDFYDYDGFLDFY